MQFISQQKVNYCVPKCVRVFYITLLFLGAVSHANADYDVILAWDPNYDENLAGYVLYVDDGFSDIMYEYVDTYPLEDIDAQNPRVIITDLRDDLAYYFVVTAYDTEGNESYYSDEICVIDGEACPESWSVNRAQSLNSASASGGGGSGGGGGCFIGTSNLAENNKKVLASKHIFLFLIYLIVTGIIRFLSMKKMI